MRLDGAGRWSDLLADGYEVSLTFLARRTACGSRSGSGRAADRDRSGIARADGAGAGSTAARAAAVAAGTVLEVALPLATWASAPGDAVAFFVAVFDADGDEVERHPAHRPVELTVPDERFEARNWTA